MDEQLDCDPGQAFVAPVQRQRRNYEIEQALRRAIQSFVAQWLSSLMQETPSKSTKYEKGIKELWRATRKDMLKGSNRISYRSVLTLYLFGQTPIPAGIFEEEELDGISGIVCTQTALLQLQQLRERLRSWRSNGLDVSACSDPVTRLASNPDIPQSFLDLENRAYWIAVTWDTSNSMTLNIRSSLTSGLKGACLEPAWCLARGFLVGAFHTRTEVWRKKHFELSDESASQIISAASVCRIYTWRTIASLKEALREGVEEGDVLLAWNAVLDALDVFKTIIYPLLNICERRLHFLGQVERLNWYEVALHYYLGILMLADAVEAASRTDLLSQLNLARLDAEQESFNVLKFGLESKYTIAGPFVESEYNSNVDRTAYSPKQQVTTSFIAIDPYPDHVVALIQLMKKAISH